jgi:CRISPR system Cascade subunit CasA
VTISLRPFWTIFVGGLLSACVGYSPAPVDAPAVLLETRSSAIDPTAVRTQLTRIAPSVDWDGRRLDSLVLLAAALETSPEIAQARAAVATAKADATVARKALGPTLTLTSEYAFNAPETSPWLFGIATDFAVDTGVRRNARVDVADLNERIALFDYMDTVWSVRQGIQRALTQRLLAGQEVAIAGKLLAMRQSQLLAMEHRLAAGAVSRLEVQRIRADMAADQRNLSDAEARAVAALSQLSAAIGVSSKALDVDALEWANVGLPDRLPDSLPAACLDEALLARPDIARASAAYDQAEAELHSAIAGQYPSLHIGPGYTWERGLKKLPLSLALALPPLDLNHAAINAAEARRSESGRKLETTVYMASNAVDVALDAYRAAWVQLDLSRQQTEIVEQLARQADTAIAAGAIDRVDWRISRLAVLTSKLSELTAQSALRETETVLEDALRRPLSGPELNISINLTSAEVSACN